MRLAILTSRIRVEEKLLVKALEQRAIAFDIIDDGELLFDLARPGERWRAYDAVLCRSVSQSLTRTCQVEQQFPVIDDIEGNCTLLQCIDEQFLFYAYSGCENSQAHRLTPPNLLQPRVQEPLRVVPGPAPLVPHYNQDSR